MLELFWYLFCVLIGVATGCLLILSKQCNAFPLGILIATATMFGLLVIDGLIFN